MKTAAQKPVDPSKKNGIIKNIEHQSSNAENVILEPRQSFTIERNPDDSISALIVSGTRFERLEQNDQGDSDRVGFEMPESVAKTIVLTEVNFPIVIYFKDLEEYGTLCYSVRNTKADEWEVEMLVHQDSKSYKHPICLYAYGRDVLDAIDGMLATVIFSAIGHKESTIRFSIETYGKTIEELLVKAREEVDDNIP